MTRVSVVETTITAQNQFTDPLQLDIKDRFSVTIGSGLVGTITVQVSYDGGTTWFDVKTYTLATVEISEPCAENAKYRIGVKTGDFTSGTGVLRLGRG